jgi:hypothetical protein
MAETTTQLVETHLRVIDQATGPLAKIAKNAEHVATSLHRASAAGHGGAGKLGGAFEALSGTLSKLGGLGLVVGGGLSFHSALETTEKYLENIKQVKELTGATASETDFLFSNARKAGVPYETMATTMFQLSRRGSQLATSQHAMTQQVPGMAKRFASLGVDMKKGPVKSLEAMSAAVKAGKIGAGELMSQFRIPQKDANDMEKFLREMDPKKLARARKGGKGFVSDGDIEAFDRMQEAQHRIADAWNRIQVTVVKYIYPIAAKMAESFAANIERVLPPLEDAMAFVALHMDKIVTAAKIFASVMTGKKVLEVLAGAASPGGLLAKLSVGNLGSLVSGAGGAGMGAQITAILGAFAKALPVIAVIAAAVWLLAKGVEAIYKNVDGLRDRFYSAIDLIRGRLEVVGERILGVWNRLVSAFDFGGGKVDNVGKTVGNALVTIVEFIDWTLSHFIAFYSAIYAQSGQLADFAFDILDGWEKWIYSPLVQMARSVGDIIQKALGGDFKGALRAFGDFQRNGIQLVTNTMLGLGEIANKKRPAFMDSYNAALADQQAAAEKNAKQYALDRARMPERSAPSERDKKQFNFPNARFDITQQFAEGFDPDRIAVAFANDLAAIGEMRTQSSLSQAFSIR